MATKKYNGIAIPEWLQTNQELTPKSKETPIGTPGKAEVKAPAIPTGSSLYNPNYNPQTTPTTTGGNLTAKLPVLKTVNQTGDPLKANTSKAQGMDSWNYNVATAHEVKTPQPKTKDDVETSWLKTIGTSIMEGISNLASSFSNVGELAGKVDKALDSNYALKKGVETIGKTMLGQTGTMLAGVALKSANKMQPIFTEGEKEADEATRYWQGQKKDITGAKKVVGEAVASLPQMLLNFVPVIGTTLFATSAGSSYAKQAELEGANVGQQLAYGVAGGALENLTEKIPLEAVKKTWMGKWINTGAKNLLGKYGEGALMVLGSTIAEGIQEGITDPAANIAKAAIYKPDMKAKEIFDFGQAGNSATVGATMGAILAAMALPKGFKSRRMVEQILDNGIKPTPEMNTLVQEQIKEDLQTVNEQQLDEILTASNQEADHEEAQKSMQETEVNPSNNIQSEAAENQPVKPVVEDSNSPLTPEVKKLPMLTSKNKVTLPKREVKQAVTESTPIADVPTASTTREKEQGSVIVPNDNKVAQNEDMNVLESKETSKADLLEEAKKNTNRIDIKDINVDPDRFQFKNEVDKTTGAGKSISDIQKWDDNLAGRITVWEDNQGKLWVVNGHHRLNKAKQFNVSDIDAKVLREADGITAKDAREIGAKINLAEGRGTATDAAKLFRDGNYTIADLKESGLSLKEGLIKTGYNIAQLNDRLFNKVINKTITDEQASLIGEAFPKGSKSSEANQNAAMDYIDKHGDDITNYKLKEVIDGIKNSSVSQVQQMTLLGAETIFNNNFENKADIIAAVKRKLSMEKNLFSNLVNSKKAEAALKAGNNLNAEANEKSKLLAERALEFIDKDKWFPSTPIGTVFEKYANLMDAGMKLSKASEEAFGEVKAIIESGDFLKPKEEAKEAPKNDNIDGQIDLFGGLFNEKQRETETSPQADGRGTATTGEQEAKSKEAAADKGASNAEEVKREEEKQEPPTIETKEEDKPEVINNRDTITIERVGKDNFVVNRGDKVKVFLGNNTDGTKKYSEGTVVGISQANKTVKVLYDDSVNKTGLDIDISSIYPPDVKEATPIENGAKLSEVIESSNKKNEPVGGFTEADRVPQPKEKKLEVLKPTAEEQPLHERVRLFMKNLMRGELTSYEEVIKEANYIMDNEDEIKKSLSSLKNDELKKQITGFYRNDYNTKPKMVDHIYYKYLNNLYYSLGDTNSISLGIGGKERTEDTIKRMVKNIIEKLDSEKFTSLMEKYKAEVKEAVEKRKKQIEGIKKPETLEDYKTAKQVRKLTPDEQEAYEDLLAVDNKERTNSIKERQEENRQNQAASKVSESAEYTIEKSVHTKKQTDIWIARPKERLDSEAFKTLKTSMSKLGAYYSSFKGVNGFVFEYDPTEVLKGEKPANEVISKEPEKTNFEKLRVLSEKEDLGESRRKTILNIAKAMEEGKLKLIDKLQFLTEFDTLDSLLRQGQYKRTIEEKINHPKDSEGRWIYPEINNLDTRYVEMPGEELYTDTIRYIMNEAKDKQGTVLFTRKLAKLIEGKSANDKVEIPKRMMEDFKDYIKKIGMNKSPYTIHELFSKHSRLERLGITTDEELRAYLREYLKYRKQSVKTKEEVDREDKIKYFENLVNANIPGFFPTPEKLVDRLIEEADIKEGDKVLEPSAGNGAIADKIGIGKVDVVEWNNSLNEYLKFKGHNVIGSDALEVKGQYDKIVMNPPFEKNQDIKHVMYAYNNNLKPGGRLVAIMSEHPFFASDKESKEFREFLDTVGWSEENPEGAFLESARKTGVHTRLVVMEKPAEAVKETKSENKTQGLTMNLTTFSEDEDYMEAKKYLQRTGQLPSDAELEKEFIKSKMEDIPKQQRKFIANSMLNALVVPDEMKQEFIAHPEWYEYIQKSNQQTMDWARHEIEVRFNEHVTRLSRNTSLKSEQDTALAIEIERKYILDGNFEAARDWSLRVARMGTHTGRAVQYFSVLKRFTPEWTLNHIQKKLDDITDPNKKQELDETVQKIAEGINEENKKAIEEVVDKILKGKSVEDIIKKAKENTEASPPKENNNPPESEKEELTAEERLANRIEDHMELPNDYEYDPIKVMVKTLYDVAKEKLPVKENPNSKPDYKVFINKAMQEKEEYQRVWDAAKEIVEERFKDNEEALNELSEYFNQFLTKPFSDSMIDKEVKKQLKDLKINLIDLVKDQYMNNSIKTTLSEKLISNGLDIENALLLEKYIAESVDRLTLEAKTRYIKNLLESKKLKGDRKALYDRIIELSNLGVFTSDKYKDMIAEKYNIPYLSSSDIQRLMQLTEEVQKHKEGSRERKEAQARVIEFMEMKLPKPILAYINAYQTINMLLNVKTAGRNILSNFLFGFQTHVKDYFKAGIDKGLSLATGKRTAAMPSLKTKTEGLKEGATEAYLDFKHNVNTKTMDDNKLELRSGKVFTSGVMGQLERLSRLFLDDRPFQGAEFKDQLRRFEEVAKLNNEEFNIDNAIKEAKLRADIVTFNDHNIISDSMIKVKRALNGNKEWGLGDILLKFVRTPVNIFVREIEYTPYSFVKAIVEAGVNAKRGEVFDQERFAEDIAKSVTGTAIIGLGIFLFKIGAIILDDDDKDKQELLDNVGAGRFKINVSAITRFLRTRKAQELEDGDNLVGYDWAVPFSSNITLGASMAKTKDGTNFKGMDMLTSYSESLLAGMNNIFDQPFLQGIQSVFKYDKPVEGVFKAALKTPTSLIPLSSTMKQIRYLNDNKNRETYSPGMFKEMANNIVNGIPIASKTLEQRYDTLGDEKEVYKESMLGKNNPFNVMLNPSNISKYLPSKEASYVLKLAENANTNIAIPRVNSIKDFEYNELDGSKGKIVLTTKEYTEFQRILGINTKDKIQKLMKNTNNTVPDDPKLALEASKELSNAMEDIVIKIKEKILKDRGYTKVQKKGDRKEYWSLTK